MAQCDDTQSIGYTARCEKLMVTNGFMCRHKYSVEYEITSKMIPIAEGAYDCRDSIYYHGRAA